MTVHRFGNQEPEENELSTNADVSAAIDAAEAEADKQDEVDDDTLYAEMREELGKPAAVESEIRISISSRPHFELSFNTDIPYDRLKIWINNCRPKGARKNQDAEDLDMRRFSMMVLVAKHTGIYFKGRLMRDESGRPLKFDSPKTLELTKQLDKASVISWLFGGRDGEIMRAANKITEAAGYGDIDYGDFDDAAEEDDPLA